ncbi:MAG TPA: permease-like cell division protein FtsX [Gemmatimonadaceae bacterium]|nr:permease-like cell division protein FtsX [Gemmatimonadaceae bacterium]
MRLTIREALLSFRRAPLLSALSVMMVAFSLFSFGLFALVAINFEEEFSRVEARVEIQAFVDDTTSVTTLTDGVAAVARYSEVQRAAPITREEALSRARESMGEFRDVFDAEFLPASIEVQLKEGFRDAVSVRRVADSLEAIPYVNDVRYGEEFVQQLDAIRTVATGTGIALGTAFALVAIIIIAATIRIAVLARAREISIMRLVGATNGFIRRPFLLEGLLTGVAGGLLALLLLRGAFALVTRFDFVNALFLESSMAVTGIAAGGLLGFMGSAFAVRRHLKHV